MSSYTEIEVTAIFVESGSGEDSTGDEVRSYYVYPGNDDGEDALEGKGSFFGSRGAALDWAERLASNYCVTDIEEV
jgi:hypothetical protein